MKKKIYPLKHGGVNFSGSYRKNGSLNFNINSKYKDLYNKMISFKISI